MSGEGERLTFISRNFWRDKCHVRHTCKFWGKRTLERALLSYCDMDNLQVLVSMSTTYCPVWYYYPNKRSWWANDKHLSIMLLPPTTIRINKKATVNYRVWLRCPRLSMVGHIYVSEYNITRDNNYASLQEHQGRSDDVHMHPVAHAIRHYDRTICMPLQ